MLAALLIGLVLGFAGSMPIAGPTAALVVSRALENRGRAALYVSIGSAVPEGVYAFMAFWGLTTLLSRYPHLLPASRLIACLVLVALGVYFLVHRLDQGKKAPDRAASGWRDVLLGFTLAAANPTLVVTWTAAVGIAHSTGLLRVDARDALPFAFGVTVGIVGWFAFLVFLLERFRAHVNARTLATVIRGMGVVLIACGIGLGVRAVGWLDTKHSEPVERSESRPGLPSARLVA